MKNSTEYMEKATRTDLNGDQYMMALTRVTPKTMMQLEHGIIGLVTEVGELADALKKHKYYGKPFDQVNVKEELSDIFWYMGIICKSIGATFEEIQEMNIAKLQKRYPDKFTEENALNRDVNVEREILEKHASTT